MCNIVQFTNKAVPKKLSAWVTRPPVFGGPLVIFLHMRIPRNKMSSVALCVSVSEGARVLRDGKRLD